MCELWLCIHCGTKWLHYSSRPKAANAITMVNALQELWDSPFLQVHKEPCWHLSSTNHACYWRKPKRNAPWSDSLVLQGVNSISLHHVDFKPTTGSRNEAWAPHTSLDGVHLQKPARLNGTQRKLRSFKWRVECWSWRGWSCIKNRHVNVNKIGKN